MHSAHFNHDGTKIVSASHDRTVRVWDVVTGSCEKTLAGHSSNVYSANFNHDGTKIVSASGDRTVCVWDVGTVDSDWPLVTAINNVRIMLLILSISFWNDPYSLYFLKLGKFSPSDEGTY